MIPAEHAGAIAGDALPLLVPFAQRFAVAPISSFAVGAVARGTSGSLYLGANLEVVGVPLSFSVHAEQAAATSAWLHGEEALAAIAVSAAPCGYCRQFLQELVSASTLEIVVDGEPPRLFAELLPDAFGPRDLGVDAALMAPQDHGLRLDGDALVREALAAANASYAPYTGGFGGVALQTAGGRVYTGRYAENAAFNPSLAPLASALAMRALGGDADDSITRAALVEAAAPISHAGATAQVLHALAPGVELEAYAV